ncbi:PAS domain-containing protein [Streptomyces sp. NPDC046977]|uniref:PAS domain-containing protein n=1 Tax=Streptomyces sp. NPDC046977 TaxID=3154703 RepID=UPI0033D8D38F
MTRTEKTTLNDTVRTQVMSDSASAMLDERGTIVGWTQAAQRLLGHSARGVVGRSAALLLPPSEEASVVNEFVEQCRARGGWSGTARLRHRDGCVLDVSLRVSLLRGRGTAVRWLVCATEIGKLSWAATQESVRESLISRAPLGVVIRDTQLRCTWVNDTMEGHDAIPANRGSEAD